eukprot:scaffold13981_cov52-Phaeocystis_antarctica.AAC.1
MHTYTTGCTTGCTTCACMCMCMYGLARVEEVGGLVCLAEVHVGLAQLRHALLRHEVVEVDVPACVPACKQ